VWSRFCCGRFAQTDCPRYMVCRANGPAGFSRRSLWVGCVGLFLCSDGSRRLGNLRYMFLGLCVVKGSEPVAEGLATDENRLIVVRERYAC
jgi:hypothetical protein